MRCRPFMPLTPGTRLGAYEVGAAIGEGGMGQVYRARDTRLNRDVAIKIVPEAFQSDPDRVARFTREAQTLAALNHPHIAQVYGIEETVGPPPTRALVMEFVDGEPLSARVARGRVPADEATAIARQVVDALEAAHEKGIIHRDLKPANIMLTGDGQVKVLDFGLAKDLGPAAGGRPSADGLGHSPTITTPAMTQAGMILGTAAYMSPEQAKGRTADKRSDIWSFACVLYELLTGRRAFGGEDVSDTLAAVLRGEPDWSLLPKNTPGTLRSVLRRCLVRDAKARVPDFSVVRFLLDEAPTPEPQAPESKSPRWQATVPWAVAVIALTASAALWFRTPPTATGVDTVQRVMADTGVGGDLTTDVNGSSAAVLSPDGQRIVFLASTAGSEESQLFVRRLDQLEATPLSGTNGAFSPFFSPDGQWVAFFDDTSLRKIPTAGGASVKLCDAPAGRGGSWGDDGFIAYSPSNAPGTALWRVSAAGGTPEPLTTLVDGEVTHRFPHVLPGSRAVLFMAHTTVGTYEDATLVVQELPNGPRKVLVRGGYYGRYVPSGHVLYIHEGTVFAAAMDLARLELTSTPVPVLQHVNGGLGGGAHYSLSDSGTLTYVTGSGQNFTVPMDWLTRQGKPTTLRAEAIGWSNPAFSPDGRQLAVDLPGPQGFDIWISEWERNIFRRLTFNQGLNPVWTPDGQGVIYAVRGEGRSGLRWQRADGSGEAHVLTEAPFPMLPWSVHPTGKFVLAGQNRETGWDIVLVPLEGTAATGLTAGTPSDFVRTPFSENSAAFSPDGRWVAYGSTEGGSSQVFVRPFQGNGGRWQVSVDGGTNPSWSRNGRELFFENNRQIMVASLTVDQASFQSSTPVPWSDVRFVNRTRSTPFHSVALHPEGARFVAASRPDVQRPPRQVVLVFNFFDELRRLTDANPAK